MSLRAQKTCDVGKTEPVPHVEQRAISSFDGWLK